MGLAPDRKLGTLEPWTTLLSLHGLMWPPIWSMLPPDGGLRILSFEVVFG